jgi:Cu(I)/Ag(I) efflux system periplasmic protein CusF
MTTHCRPFHSMLTATLAAWLCLAAGAAAATEGEVKKVDVAQGKVTLKHAEIKNLDMPAMTMVFRAQPATLLNGLAPGDVVDFTADKVDGQYVVTAVRKLR